MKKTRIIILGLLFVVLVACSYGNKERCPELVQEVEGCGFLKNFIEDCQKLLILNVTEQECNKISLSALPETCQSNFTEVANLIRSKKKMEPYFAGGCSLITVGSYQLAISNLSEGGTPNKESIEVGDVIRYHKSSESQEYALMHKVIYIDKDVIITESDGRCVRDIIPKESDFSKIHKLIILKNDEIDRGFLPVPIYDCAFDFGSVIKALGNFSELNATCHELIKKYEQIVFQPCWTIKIKKDVLDYTLVEN